MTTAADPQAPAGARHTLEGAWQLSPSVQLRPEPFGALAYDFATRQLSFLKSPLLVDVVRRLAEESSVQDALVSAGVPTSSHPSYVVALRTLATTGIIKERAA